MSRPALPVHWVDAAQDAAVSPFDRGFSYGDGVFETFRCVAGEMQLREFHLRRLGEGLRRLDIECSPQRVDARIDQGLDYLRENSVADAAGRLVISRGVGKRGYGGDSPRATIALSLSEVSPWRETLPPLAVDICSVHLAEQPRLAGIKHCNRLEQVLAAREMQARGLDEGLMSTAAGDVVCGISGNVFALIEGSLLTPPVDRCGIEGTVRALILDELAADAGLDVQVAGISTADIPRAEELFMTNALWGIRAVSRCGEHRFTSSRLGDTLRSSFHKRCESREC